MSKTDRTLWVCGDEVPVYVCDQCEEEIGTFLHWDNKDFTLCPNCLEKSYKSLFQIDLPKTVNKTKKPIPHKVKKEMFERDGYRCRYCGSHIDLVADHIFPESRGGETSLTNLVTACASCNSKKGARTPDEAGMKLLRV